MSWKYNYVKNNLEIITSCCGLVPILVIFSPQHVKPVEKIVPVNFFFRTSLAFWWTDKLTLKYKDIWFHLTFSLTYNAHCCLLNFIILSLLDIKTHRGMWAGHSWGICMPLSKLWDWILAETSNEVRSKAQQEEDKVAHDVCQLRRPSWNVNTSWADVEEESRVHGKSFVQVVSTSWILSWTVRLSIARQLSTRSKFQMKRRFVCLKALSLLWWFIRLTLMASYPVYFLEIMCTRKNKKSSYIQ